MQQYDHWAQYQGRERYQCQAPEQAVWHNQRQPHVHQKAQQQGQRQQEQERQQQGQERQQQEQERLQSQRSRGPGLQQCRPRSPPEQQ
mmetsp:Transcript_24989/g.43674  ORF Transcript_24989/g.43674 Transcript_24989/m.43674 type:complete len:88 (+) Transcript_24989:1216-1479(+)